MFPPPGGPGAPAQLGSTPTGPGTGNNKKWVIIGGAALTALLLLIGIIFGSKAMLGGGGDSAAQPESGSAEIPTEVPQGKEYVKPVLDYFSMVKRGDADGVRKLVEASIGTPDNPQLLTPEIMRKAAERITDVRVDADGPTYEGMTSAMPKISYDINGKHYVETFSVEKSGDSWQISRLDLPEVNVDTQRTSIQVNGQPVRVDPSSYSTRSLAATPGVYDFEAPKTKYLGGSSTAVTVAAGTSALSSNVKLKETVTPAFAKDAAAAINAYVASCAKTPDREIDCPLYASVGTKWQITRKPTYSFSEGTEGGEFRVDTKVTGSAKYRRDYGGGYVYDGTRSYSPTGTITVTGERLKYEP